MQKTKDSQYYFFILLLFTSFFYLAGNIICYTLPLDSSVCVWMEEALTDNLKSGCPIDVASILCSFIQELKIPFFIVIAAFTSRRFLLTAIALSYKGLSCGMCTACFMKAVSLGKITLRYEAFCSFAFTLLSVCTLCLLCFLGVKSLTFCRKILYPLKFSVLFKRKDTYEYIIDILALCGILLIIIFLKPGNCNLIISPKGM